jgi:hypothetical protein
VHVRCAATELADLRVMSADRDGYVAATASASRSRVFDAPIAADTLPLTLPMPTMSTPESGCAAAASR